MLFAGQTLKTLTILSFFFHLYALSITYRVSADVSDQLIFESPNSGLYRQSHYRDLTAGFMMVPLVIAAKMMDATGVTEEAHLLYWTRLLVRAAWMSFYLMAMILYQHLSRRWPAIFARVTTLHHIMLKVCRILAMRWISKSWLYDEILTRSITTVPAALVYMSPRSFSMPELAILGPAMKLLICDWAGRIVNMASSFVLGKTLFTRPDMPLPLSGFSDFLAPILLLFCISQVDISPKWLRPHHTSLLFALLILFAALFNTNALLYIHFIYERLDMNTFRLLCYWVCATAPFLILNVAHPPAGADDRRLNTRRKYFHLLLVLLLIPVAHAHAMISLAIFGMLTLSLLVEALRLHKMCPTWLDRWMQAFVNDKDQGEMIMSHIYLLLGGGVGWILSATSLPGTIGGLISIGIGDTMASLVGYRYGRHKWPNSRKSIEGTLAHALSTFGVGVLCQYNANGLDQPSVMTWLLISTGGALLEAFSDTNDNLLVPLWVRAVYHLGRFLKP